MQIMDEHDQPLSNVTLDPLTLLSIKNAIKTGLKFMNAFELTKKHLISGITEAQGEGIDGAAYGQAMMWNLLQYYHSLGRKEDDIRGEVQYALDNIDDDGDFHVSRN
jgi:hypothetical protein